MRDGELIDNGASSLYRAFAGLALAIAVGGGLGMAMARWRLLDVFINNNTAVPTYAIPMALVSQINVFGAGGNDEEMPQRMTAGVRGAADRQHG